MQGKSYSEQFQQVVRDYRDSGQPWPASSREIAAWALENKRWQPHRGALITQLAELLSHAMREEYVTDPQGRTVRAKHAARTRRGGENLVLWDDIRTAPRSHMEIAFKQRRQQIVGDCRQLKMDVDSFNDNSTPEKPIQMVFDFTDDLLELEVLDRVAVLV